MLLAVPYQTIELAKLQIDPFYTDRKGRRTAPLFYIDRGLTFIGCSIRIPALPLLSYDITTNRIQLDCTKAVGNRLHAIQDMIAMHIHGQRHLFSDQYSLRDIHGILQKLYLPSVLTVYAYPTTPVRTESDSVALHTLKPGQPLACVLRLHSLLLLENRGTPHIRIQHSIVALSVS